MPIAKRTEQATQDLEEIGIYIGGKRHRPSVAAKIIREIKAKCDLLARHPHMGTDRSELGDDIRAFSHRRWVIIFRPWARKHIRALKCYGYWMVAAISDSYFNG